jgi:hypothetical protein
LAGEIHYLRTHGPGSDERSRPRDLRYRTSYTVSAVRGTEFELHNAPGRPDIFIPIDGKISLTATAAAKSLPALPGGLEKKEAWVALASGSLARVSEVRGSVRIRTASGSVVSADPATSLQAGDEIQTGAGSSVLVDLADRYQMALGSDSRLTAVSERASGKPLYAIRKGAAHIWGNGETGPTFVTPNTVEIPRAREFEITVAENGLARVALREGSLEISAVASRLDRSKLDPWWEK